MASDIVNNGNSAGECNFIGGVYDVTTAAKLNYQSCIASKTNFTNFVYQVSMTIISGDCGGMIFRSDTHGNYYFFEICQNGNFSLRAIRNNHDVNTQTLPHGYTPFLRQNRSIPNLIAVIIRGNFIELYINLQLITSIYDNANQSGIIGVTATDYNNPTEVIYNNAKVWIL